MMDEPMTMKKNSIKEEMVVAFFFSLLFIASHTQKKHSNNPFMSLSLFCSPLVPSSYSSNNLFSMSLCVCLG
jgi:hypothetical protein